MTSRFSLPEYCPKQIISGAIHYFRVHPDLWDDRLDKAVAFGLNTVETYIPWNCHEPHRGEFIFRGQYDLEAYIGKVAAHGLKLILRPGPYICAEWDNGGFPGWLSAVPGIRFRRTNEPYFEAVGNYFRKLLPMLKKHLATSGGPVILLQVENEYGSYGNDKEYLQFLRGLYLECGMDVPFFTSDGPYGHYPRGGSIPEALVTANFGTKAREAFASIRALRPEEPDFCMEFWDGWFDHWGKGHHLRPAADGGEGLLDEVEFMLASGAHFNFYMFHGGTNFGFTAGANGNRKHDYEATVTSYDYDCMLSECGDPTEKFFECQKLIRKYSDNPRIASVVPAKKVVPKPVRLTQSVPLFSQLDRLGGLSGKAVTPPTMEELGENFGFIYYRKRLDGIVESPKLRLLEVNDFAQIWQDGVYCGSRMRDCGEKEIRLEAIPEEGSLLEILVENMGRINYGPFTGIDRKGIVHGIALDLQQQFRWEYKMLPLDDLSGLVFGPFSNGHGQVMFHRGEFTLEETGEAFLAYPGVKGTVWVNGFHLGRYWDVGPARTLYVPSAALRRGPNEIIILEQEKLHGDEIIFRAEHDLGEPIRT